MTLQEKIKQKAEEYGELAQIFIEGANFALDNQWIRVEDNLPYEYLELFASIDITVPILTKTDRLNCFVQNMYCKGQEWEFSEGGGVSHWMPIPKLPKK